MLRGLLDGLLAGRRGDPLVLWSYTPMALAFTDHLAPDAIVYDCMDELSGFRGAAAGLRAMEQRLFDRADLVFAGGASLYEAKRHRHHAVHAFPSSIDAAHFARARGPDHLSRFTAWRPYEHRVLAKVDGQLLPIPINLDTVNRLYGLSLEPHEMEAFLAARAEPVETIRTSEDVVVSRVGRDLYEKFFRRYTRKQWGLDPSELDKSVTARVPTRTDRDDRYFADRFQAMPAEGYTRMFERMLAHPNIKVLLQADFREIRETIPFRRMVFTGPVDAFCGYRFGRLPYRSLRFRHVTLDKEWHQPVAVVNHPMDEAYTRVTEYKHLTGQHHRKTTLTYEYPSATGDPYYPIPRPENAALYKRYETQADAERDVWFVGRLATYRYDNMDQVVGQALATFARIDETERLRDAGLSIARTARAVRIFSTPLLADQAARENERRWLGFDLLCGRIDRDHPWFRDVLAAGIGADDLALFREGEARPDILGINHYLTSDRHLDEDEGRYPPHTHGGNGRHRYADAEAVRMPWPAGETGFAPRLREAWARYRLPMAITEAHHGCTRDEQVRWLAEAWSDARAVRAEGIDLRAVTVWSLFGAVDWNTLLTRRSGFYEPGPFDARSDPPRPTALAAAIDGLRLWAIVNAAGYALPPDAPEEPGRCVRENVDGALVLARAAADAGLPLVAFSSDLIFDGMLGRPYVQDDATGPRCAWGASKAEAERRVSAAHADALIVRAGAFFGPWEPTAFATTARRAVEDRGRFEAEEDVEMSPAYVPDLVHAALDLLIDGASGVWHLANDGACTRHDLARTVVTAAGFDPGRIVPLSRGEPRSTVLASRRGVMLPALEDAFARYLRDTAA